MPLTVGSNAYKSATDFLESLPQQMETFTPDQQKKIQTLCRMILGPDPLSIGDESTTEKMIEVSMPRSYSNEDLTETIFTQAGIQTAFEALKLAIKDTSNKYGARMELKSIAASLKENQEEPYFERLVDENHFSSLNEAERGLPDQLSALKESIVNLTANIASITVQAKNSIEFPQGISILENSYQEQQSKASAFVQKLNSFKAQIDIAVKNGCAQTNKILEIIHQKKEQIYKISKANAIERANLAAQEKIGFKQLGMTEKYRFFGSINSQFPPVTEPKGKGDALQLRLDETTLTPFFNEIQKVLASVDHHLSHKDRDTLAKLLVDRHIISENVGEVKGLLAKMQKTKELYTSAWKTEQLLINELHGLIKPLESFKAHLNTNLLTRSAAIERQRAELLNVFADLYQKAQELKKALPDCRIELKPL